MIELGGREFKLLLLPEVLGGKEGLAGARHFEALLKRAVADSLGPRKTGKRRCESAFASDERRIVHFWDDGKGTLRGGDVLARTRVDANSKWEPQGKRELTLKFRTDDIALGVLAHVLLGEHNEDTEFEEDIAPLQIGGGGKSLKPIVRPDPPAMRSRFSVSSKVKLGKAPINTARDLIKLVPGVERCYRMATGTVLDGSIALGPGPKVHEQTFGGVVIEMGGSITAECCLTIWEFPGPPPAGGNAPPKQIVEFSYKVPFDDKSEDAARRIRKLFLDLQANKTLPSEMQFTSKTEFALP